MKIAVCSDELYPINDYVVKELERLGHEVTLFGRHIISLDVDTTTKYYKS